MLMKECGYVAKNFLLVVIVSVVVYTIWVGLFSRFCCLAADCVVLETPDIRDPLHRRCYDWVFSGGNWHEGSPMDAACQDW